MSCRASRSTRGDDGDGSVDYSAGDFGDNQPWRTRNGSGDGDDMPALDQAAARPRTLREHLLEQIGADLPNQADRVIAAYLLDQLDETGYLRGGIEDAAARLGCGPERIAYEWWRQTRPQGRGEAEMIRDYYRVEDEAGRRFWVFRAGPYRPGRPPRWFLHGMFE